ERDVHVRALAHVAGLVDEDAVVETALLRLHLHEDVGQVGDALGDRVQGRFDRIGRRHDPEPLRVPGVRIGEPGRDHHEEAGLGAGRRGEAEAPRPRRSPVADRALAPPAGGGGPHDDVAHLVPCRERELRVPGRPDEPIQVRLEVVDLAALDRRGVEDAVAAVHHVVVERDDHQRRVGHDPAELARVERPVLDRLPGPERPELLDYLTGRQHWQSGRHRHDHLLHAAMYHPSPASLRPGYFARRLDHATKVSSPARPRRVVESRAVSLPSGGKHMIGQRLALVLCVVVLTGCASAHYYTLPKADAVGACQTAVPQRDLLRGVALSGGGSRAALFAEAGLETLAQIRMADGNSLISRIDHLSSVSGGSLSAIYYVLKKPGRDVAVLNADGSMSTAYRTFFDQYRSELSQDFETALIWRQLLSFRWLNSALAAKTLAEILRAKLYGDARVQDLSARAKARHTPELIRHTTPQHHAPPRAT